LPHLLSSSDVHSRALTRARLLALVAPFCGLLPAAAEPSGGGPCASTDRALGAVAEMLAEGRVANDSAALTEALRRAGAPYVFPRALVLSGPRVESEEARSRAAAWLRGGSRNSARSGERRCASARSSSSSVPTLALLAVDAEAELDPLPPQVRVGGWIDVRARTLVPAHAAKVVVLGPSGPPRPVPTSLSAGRIRARANLDRPGGWLVQVLIDGEGGPRPALEMLVFAGAPSPSRTADPPAPGEEEALRAPTEAAALGRMIDAARRTEGLEALQRDDLLDSLARAHAARMMRAETLAHDVADGDPAVRLEAAGFQAREVGENVAHAASVALAHRAVWGSPSHRGNLLGERFDRVGVGVVKGPDGTVWITELFAATR
jgi:uncharacterized protein YkwD